MPKRRKTYEVPKIVTSEMLEEKRKLPISKEAFFYRHTEGSWLAFWCTFEYEPTILLPEYYCLSFSKD